MDSHIIYRKLYDRLGSRIDGYDNAHAHNRRSNSSSNDVVLLMYIFCIFTELPTDFQLL